MSAIHSPSEQRRTPREPGGRRYAFSAKAFFGALAICAFLLPALVAGCEEGGPAIAGSALRDDGTAVLRLLNQQGHAVNLEAEVADSDDESRRGLSMRESLAPDWGMLFVFSRRGLGFWMKDTLIPLSVAFIAPCGEIVHIAHMEPGSLRIHNTDREYRYGLEVNQGWFEEHGIATGDKVEIPAEFLPGDCSPSQ